MEPNSLPFTAQFAKEVSLRLISNSKACTGALIIAVVSVNGLWQKPFLRDGLCSSTFWSGPHLRQVAFRAMRGIMALIGTALIVI